MDLVNVFFTPVAPNHERHKTYYKGYCENDTARCKHSANIRLEAQCYVECGQTVQN